MPIKVRFLLRAEPAPTSPKTTVSRLYALQLLDDDDDSNIYAIPDEFKDIKHHDTLFTLPAAAAAKRAELKPRWKTRGFKVVLTDDVAKLYLDSDGNPIFNGTVMDELDDDGHKPTFPSTTPSSAPTEDNKPARSLSSIVKDAVILKFSGSKLIESNASAWLEIFESECRRLEIPESKYWEVLRLFLQDAAEKWYATTRLSNLSTSWTFWKESFLENFGQHGIGAARYAFSYRFITGSVRDYVQTKLNLLVSFNPKMHELDKIAHLIIGLPPYLQERLSLADQSSLGKLISSIYALDCPITRKINPTPVRSNPSSSAFSSLRPKTPCPYCKKKGFDRFHLEKDCFTKFKDSRSDASQSKPNNSNSNVKTVHNIDTKELQEEINEYQKNE